MASENPIANDDDFESELEREASEVTSGDAGKSRAAFLVKMEGAQESTRRHRRTAEFLTLAAGIVSVIIPAATSLLGDASTPSVDWGAILKGIGAAVGGVVAGLGLALLTNAIGERRQARSKLQSSQLRALDRQAQVLETYLETQQWFLSNALTRQPGARS